MAILLSQISLDDYQLKTQPPEEVIINRTTAKLITHKTETNPQIIADSTQKAKSCVFNNFWKKKA